MSFSEKNWEDEGWLSYLSRTIENFSMKSILSEFYLSKYNSTFLPGALGE